MTMNDMDEQQRQQPPNRHPRKRPRHHLRRRRLRDLERDAARRTLNGNGMNDSLPPLPVADDNDDHGSDNTNHGGNDASDDNDDNGGGSGDFGTLFGHPYGALPYGNIHLAVPPPTQPCPASSGEQSPASSSAAATTAVSWHPDIIRHRGLGHHLRQLNDEQVLTILSYVDGPTLASGIVATSRFLYVAGHHEELWRDLVLRRWGEDGFTVMPPEKDVGVVVMSNDDDGRMGAKDDDITLTKKQTKNSGCWKDIYAYNHYHQALQSSSSSSPPPILLRHKPMQIAGIYSDTFFRSFLCRSFALQPSWLSTHTVPTLSHTEVTTQLFVKEYEERNMPLLIKGASKSWPALGGGSGGGEGSNTTSSHKWNTKYLLEKTSGKTFRATSGAAPLPAQFNLTDYFHYCASSSTEEAPLYLFDRTFATKCPQLLEDFDGALKESCGWWGRGNEEAGHDLLSVLGEGRRPDYQWLIIGPKRLK
ncbi:hypothetical protein ACHAXR_003885 [Thalassiosira sp. AJA248-18]